MENARRAWRSSRQSACARCSGRWTGSRGSAARSRRSSRPHYEEKVAVDDVTFSLEPGELVGYIGPNGAGKSTTIKMLTGILVPTAGRCASPGSCRTRSGKRTRPNIGVVFGQRSQLYWDLPLRESFELLRSIYDVPRDRYLENMRHFAEILDLDRFLATPVRQLSLGERMRGDFAAAMLHDPRIVYLDEPTIGLDVVAKEAIRTFIADDQPRPRRHGRPHHARSRRRGASVQAHHPHRRGQVIYDGPLERLREEYGTHRTLVVTFAETYPDVHVDGAET